MYRIKLQGFFTLPKNSIDKSKTVNLQRKENVAWNKLKKKKK